MNARIAAYVGIGMVLAALIFDAAGRLKAQNRATSRGFPWEFVVVDSAGKAVGPVIGTMQLTDLSSQTGGQPVVIGFPFQGKWLPVYVLRSALQAAGLFFTSSDCTGQPFGDPSGSPFPATAVAGPSSTL